MNIDYFWKVCSSWIWSCHRLSRGRGSTRTATSPKSLSWWSSSRRRIMFQVKFGIRHINIDMDMNAMQRMKWNTYVYHIGCWDFWTRPSTRKRLILLSIKEAVSSFPKMILIAKLESWDQVKVKDNTSHIKWRTLISFHFHSRLVSCINSFSN